jgi:4-amino-4-deoxy-L-arabinose transferase-like glycosyltransferase
VRGALVLFALSFSVILLTFRDYGVTWDESFHDHYGEGVLAYFRSGFSDRESFLYIDLPYYGAAFDLLCALAKRVSPLGLYETRHLLNALVGLLGVLGCWKLARQLGGTRTALLAALLLLLTPPWWGHAFNNPKDIPFAAGYAWSVYYLLRVAAELPRAPIGLFVKLGLAIGMTLASRVGGLMLIGYAAVLLAWSVLAGGRGADGASRWSRARHSALGLLVTLAMAWPVMLLFWPWAQARPFQAPFEAARMMARFGWRGTVLFAGEYIHSTRLPRSYIPHWMLVTLPEIVLFGLGLGLALAAWRVARGGIDVRSAAFRRLAVVVLAAVFPIAYIVVGRPTVYDGMRHVLFVVPLLAALAARSLERAHELAGGSHPRLARAGAGLAGLYLVYILSVMVRLHPYQSVYFNRLVGGLAGAYGRYETDYWGNSYKEAVELLSRRLELESASPPRYTVFVCANPPTATYFFPPYLERTRVEEEADFLIGTTRWNCHKTVEGEVLGVVERMGTPLNFVVDRRHLKAHARRP